MRLIDVAVVSKDREGAISILETQELGPEVASAFRALTGAVSGLLSEADLQELAQDLAPGTTAAALLFEHVWATRFAVAVRAASGELVLSERIPNAVMSGARPAPRRRRLTPGDSHARIETRTPQPDRPRRPDRRPHRGDLRHRHRRLRQGRGPPGRAPQAPAGEPTAPAPAVAPVPPASDAPATSPAALSDEAIARLQQLAELHGAGILTAEEFAEQKARLLA